jgi:hypothetical protein
LSGGNGSGMDNFKSFLSIALPVIFLVNNISLPDRADVLMKFLLEKYLKSYIPSNIFK